MDMWIQKAAPLKKGALHRQLGISLDKRIPLMFLRKIVETPEGKNIKNPSKTGKGSIRVTRLLKDRALFALNANRRKK